MKKFLAVLASVASLSCSSLYTARSCSDSSRINKFCYEIQDSNGSLIPGKLIINGLGRTGTPSFGTGDAMSSFNGHENVVYSTEGKGCIGLPKGNYEAVFARGLEYSAVRERFRIETNVANVCATLKKEVATDGYFSGDFHVHAGPSLDSRVPVRDRIVQAVAEGLDVLVATDHNRQTDYKLELGTLDLESSLLTIIGDEITTPQGTYGHFNAFPLLVSPVINAAASMSAIFDEVRAQGDNVIQVNHPRHGKGGRLAYSLFQALGFDSSTRTKSELYNPGYDMLEVYNGWKCPPTYGCSGENDTRALEDWFNLLNMGFRYTATGNSDSHTISAPGVGYPRDYVFLGSRELNEKNLVEAIKEHRVIVTNGPFVAMAVNGRPVGSFFSSKTVGMDIEIQSAGWCRPEEVHVIENGKFIRRFNIGKAKFTVELNPESDSWYVVLVRGGSFSEPVVNNKGARPFAVTNPVWVDVDGNGRFDPVGGW